MKYTLSEKKNDEITITITLTQKEWEEEQEATYQKNKGKFKVEGFRTGKVPKSMIEKMYGPEVFYEDAFNDCFPKYYTQVLSKEKNLFPVDYPEVAVTNMSAKGVTYTAKIVVLPEFTVENYKGIKIEKAKVKVTKAEINHELEHMQEHHARFVEVTDRAVKDGDLINLNYSGSIDGVKFEGGTAEDQELTIGSGMFIPGFEEQMVGMNIGEEKDITVKFPENYGAKDLAGKDAVFAVKVLSIREKQLPKIDDEFAKDTTEFESLNALTLSIEERLTNAKTEQVEREAENKLIETIVDGVTLNVPEKMIDKQVDYFVEDLEHKLSHQGLTTAGYFEYLGTTEEKFRKERRKDAEKSVKTSLVLEEIVHLEKIKVTEKDLQAKYAKLGEMYNMPADKIKELLLTQGAEASITQEILTEKVIAKLKELNEIV